MATTSLYRHFAASGDLLYVGISNCTVKRFRVHLKTASWAQDIARIEIERFPSRSDARAAEAIAIAKENPRHNIHHTPAGKGSHDPHTLPEFTDGLSAAIRKAGNRAVLARWLDVHPQLVTNWIWRDKRVPAERVLDVERVSGVSRHDLRPDIFPRETA